MPQPELPPSLSGQPPMGSSPVESPSGSPGKSANAMAKVREAVKLLETALADLPTGSDPYKAVINSIQSISRHVSPSEEVPGVQQTALRDLQQGAGKNAMLQQVMRSMGGGEGGQPGGMPGGAPGGMPQMGA